MVPFERIDFLMFKYFKKLKFRTPYNTLSKICNTLLEFVVYVFWTKKYISVGVIMPKLQIFENSSLILLNNNYFKNGYILVEQTLMRVGQE